VASTDGIKILVVEDTPGDVFLIKFYLEELDPDNYEIQSVDNLTDAHYKLEQEHFDVVLLDLHLPDSQGMITLQKSVAKFPNDVFIVLTGLSDQKVGLEAVKNGAQDFLVKGRMDSKTLDSSIKFSFERSKLKRTVKIFGEALKAFEKMFDILAIVYDESKDVLDHSEGLELFFESPDLVFKTMNDLKTFFNNDCGIEESIKNCRVGEITDFYVEAINGKSYKVRYTNPANIQNICILSVSKQN
jgi:DNA-binding response OmpR family regulator